jgi:hypothetical protein
VPTWVLQELGGWKSEVMVRRYAHMSVKHLASFADQLTFPVTEPESPGTAENGDSPNHKKWPQRGPAKAPPGDKSLT